MAQWSNLPFSEPLFANCDEALLSQATAAMENAYVNEAKGQSRFPVRKRFVSLGSDQRVYLADWRNDMIAVTSSGRVFRVDQKGRATDVTGTPVSGGRRVVFAKTEDEILMAAGGPIIRFAGDKTRILSENAPNTTHVAYIDGYVVAIEPFSGRFFHSEVGNYSDWPPLNLFTAEGKPDDLVSCIVTPYRELLLAGVDSVEQFESLPQGDKPFFRRWATGEGVFAPYTLIADKNGTYAVNKLREFVRFTGQVTNTESDDVGLVLEQIDDWQDAWADVVHIRGQKFIVLQAPHATNAYDTKGITLLFDYRAKSWSFLYDFADGRPQRWAPWSYLAIWGRHFVGVPGGIEELDPRDYTNPTHGQRMLARTGHVDDFGPSRLDGLRLRFKRGTAAGARIGLRVARDNGPFSRWIYKTVGGPGDNEMVVSFMMSFGTAETWQFEYQVTDPAQIEFVGAQALVERLSY